MLLLIFRAFETAYALDASRVVEVVPRIELRAIPHAPRHVAGLLDYRGSVFPVIDFGVLIGAAPSRAVLSTRIVVANWTRPGGDTRRLGIVAERISHVVNVNNNHVVTPAMELEEAPYLGEVFRIDDGLVQLIRVDRLIPEKMQEALYGMDH